MTFPTVPTQAAGRIGFVNQLDTTATLTGPNLNTLTKAPGDLLIAIAGEYQSNAGTDAAYTGWAGGGLTWTEIRDSTGTADNRLGVAVARVVTGSETGTVTVTRSGTLVGDASMIVLVVPGTHPTTNPETTAVAVATAAAADPAALTPSWGAEDTLWIGVNGNGMTAITGSWTANNSAPTNYTDYLGTAPADTSTIGDFGLAVAFRQLNASSEDMGTFGQDTSNARSAALVIAVRPSPLSAITLTDSGAAADALSVPALVLDLDADALTGLADLDPIPTFTDQSGQANSVTQATGTAQATYRTNQTPAGKPVARLDGGDFYTKGSAPARMATQEFTWFAVVNSSAFGDNRIIMVAGASTGGREWRLFTDGTQGLIKCNTADLLAGTATRTTGTWYIVAVRYKTDGTINLYKSDGTSDGSTTSVANFVDTSADLWVGEHTGGGGKWTGDIAEVKAYNYARTDLEVTNEIAALDAKWLSAATANKTLADSGSGADSLATDNPSKSLLDAGAGTDTLVIDKPTVYEIGSAVPGIAVPGLAPAGSVPAAGAAATPKTLNDNGLGGDQLLVAAQARPTETGTAADTLAVAAQTPLRDSGQAADSLQVAQAFSITIADSGQGSDTLLVTATAPLTDVGQGTDSLQVTQPPQAITLTDSATGTEHLCHDGGPAGAPDCILEETNLAGDLTRLWDNPTSPDANWLTALDPTLPTDLRVSFPTPATAPGVGGPTVFQALVRKAGSGPDPDVTIELWEAGVFVKTLTTATVTSPAGQLVTATLTPADLTAPDGSQVELRLSGGGP